MSSILFLLGGVLVGIVIGINSTNPLNDDPTGEIKQAISDKLDRIIDDVKNTV